METFYNFLTRQFRQVYLNNSKITMYKFRRLLRLCIDIPLLLIAIPCILLLRFLSLWKIIRLEELDISRIGGAYNADWYLCGKAKGLIKKEFIDVFYFSKSNSIVGNLFWLQLWRRTLSVFPFSRLIDIVDRLNRCFLGWEKYTINVPDLVCVNNSHDPHANLLKAVLNTKYPFVNFTKEEEKQGKAKLAEMGVKENSRFICFHARDSSYLNKIQPARDFTYHDFRDSSISNYLLAAEEMTERGLYAIRTGAVVKQKLQINNSMLIDYATNGHRSEFMDIYLG